MNLDISILNRIGEKIEKANKILLISHRRPDADTIGAVLSMRRYLLSLKKKVTTACHDEIGSEHFFLPDVYCYVQNFGNPANYDLIITLDCGESKITDFHKEIPDLFSGKYPVINIDHHVSNDNFGMINLVQTNFSSTSEIMYFFLKHFKGTIDKETANLLLAGLYYDTGSFKHDNTSVQVLEVAANLCNYGANAAYVAKKMFGIIPVPTLKVWGKALSRVKINQKQIVSSMITDQDIEETGANIDDLKGADLITYINSVPESKFAMLLTEKKGLVKGSFRTSRDDIDVAAIAKKYFQGGGHKKASGFAVPGRLYANEGKRLILS